MDALARILAAEGLAVDHPPEVEAEARGAVASDGPTTDLTALPFCTIDEVESRDLDQALYVAPGRAWYAVADASWYVRPGTALWDEALRRGTSFYLPGLVAPMLPRVLSEDAVSLNPGVIRRAVVFEIALDADGRATRVDVHRARIRSRAKLDFGGVQAFLDGGAPPGDPAVAESLRGLAALGRLRLALAEERDVVRYRRKEISVGTDGLRFVAQEDLRRDVERYNEHLSVLVNTEAAKILEQRGRDAIWRVHGPPTYRATEELVATIARVVAERGLPESWRWEPEREALADYLARLPEDRVSDAIHRQAILANGEASFTATPGAHHALGAEAYGRFTAPMREIVGIFLHRELLPEGAGDDDALRLAVIEAGNRARKVQRRIDRAVNRLVLDQLLGDAARDGTLLRGTVMGVTPGKIHVRLDVPPVDVKVYAAPQIPRLGDEVSLRVLGRDATLDRWALSLADGQPPPV